jgi:dienelactone hydrolase
MRLMTSLLVVLASLATLFADGPADNIPDNVRRIPPSPKEKLAPEIRQDLQRGADELSVAIAALRAAHKGKPELLALLPDVQIFHNAVRYALAHDEIFDPKREVPFAREQLRLGLERAIALREGKAPWTTQTGLIVRGYVSRIDGSVQPYGLVVPSSFQLNSPHRHRLDVWCHGRGETLSELNFLNDRMKNPGQFTPADAFVLHPYGRYCNANKFAGEIDCFEALEHIKKSYRIDEDRIVMRGFSMGGAACWQFAVHYSDVWCAAAPGAGFSETAEFLDVFQKEKVQPTWYEKKLWRLYDCPDYAVNLFNLPTVAYSGEIDRQKQAADVMERALKKEGINLVHIIGPKTGHSYHADARREINRRIDAIAELGRDRLPRKVKFQTHTLRYNRSFWVTIEAMDEHWEPARVEAEISGNKIVVRTKGVAALTLAMGPGRCPFDPTQPVEVYFPPEGAVIEDGRHGVVAQAKPGSDRSWISRWIRVDRNTWKEVESFGEELRKRHGLQGPIDDAFLDRFIMVRPTGSPKSEAIGKWVDAEMKHAITHWRQQFRGEAIVKDDKAITDADIAESNLVLWGDPSSNAVLAKFADKLPIKWTKDGVVLGTKTFKAETHVPLLIYPNPLNPRRYVVLNSGFTYREYDYLNNARQVPKLPDYAIIDATTPMTSRVPAKVVTAGFFDEKWRLK